MSTPSFGTFNLNNVAFGTELVLCVTVMDGWCSFFLFKYLFVLVDLLAVLEILDGLVVLALIAVVLQHSELERELIDGQIVLSCMHLKRTSEKALREEYAWQPEREHGAVDNPCLYE